MINDSLDYWSWFSWLPSTQTEKSWIFVEVELKKEEKKTEKKRFRSRFYSLKGQRKSQKSLMEQKENILM